MQYSLGNMLKGGGALNPDGLALDLAFALDRSFTTDPADAGKALITSRRGPAAKFSRGSGATQVNAAGLIEYAPQNLLLPSGSATNSASTYFTRVVTGELDPDGDTTAEFTSLAAGSQARLQYTGILGFSYFSVWVKAKEGSPLPAFIHLVAGDGPKSRFDTSNWAILNDQGAIGSVEYGANGWVKLRSLFPATTASDLFKIVVTDGPTYGDGIAAGKVFILGGKQVSRNPSSQHYKTTSSAFYGPRFDHDPVTLACKGLLIEETRTNYLIHSQDFQNWSISGSVVTRNKELSIADPSGGFTSNRIIVNAGFNIYRDPIAGVPDGNRAFSIYARAVTGGVNLISYICQGAEIKVDLATGALISSAGAVGGSTVVAPASAIGADGFRWYRISSLSQITTGSAGTYLGTYTTISGTRDMYLVWGAQVEVGGFSTSYIPTIPSTASRSADVCSIIGAAFASFYNQSEGTLFASSSMFAPLVGSSRRVVTISDGTTGNRNSIGNIIPGFVEVGLTQIFLAFSGGTSQAALGVQGLTVASLNRTAGAYKVNDFAASTNGSAVVTDTGGLVAASVDRLEIGSQLSVDLLCGHIARIQYFRKRLSNAKLQTITAP